MFALRSRKRARHRLDPPPRKYLLSLEALESRYCPSSLSLQATVLPNHQVQLSGAYSCSNPGNAAVTFSGVVQASTTADTSGNYSYITSNASLGNVTATAIDKDNLSASATATIAVAAPSVTVSVATSSSSKTITVFGQVTDIDQGSLTVKLTGVVSASVSTTSNGTYSYTGQASGLGTVSASTTNEWGQSSNTAQATASVAAPTITSFTATRNSDGTWTLSGQVSATNTTGMVVTFGGLAAGNSTTVNPNGSFSTTIQMTVIASGSVTAQATDAWGQQSNVASCFIDVLHSGNN